MLSMSYIFAFEKDTSVKKSAIFYNWLFCTALPLTIKLESRRVALITHPIDTMLEVEWWANLRKSLIFKSSTTPVIVYFLLPTLQWYSRDPISHGKASILQWSADFGSKYEPYVLFTFVGWLADSSLVNIFRFSYDNYFKYFLLNFYKAAYSSILSHE